MHMAMLLMTVGRTALWVEIIASQYTVTKLCVKRHKGGGQM